jgi:hypothetical protein
MALTDRLINAARVQLPGALDTSFAAELYAVVDEACRDGFIWRETVTVPFVAGQTTYEIMPAGTEIVHVFSVSHATLSMWNVTTEFGTVTLPFTPTAAHASGDPFFVVVALTPALGSTDIEAFLPQDMWSEHHRMLLSGLLSRMMLQPAKPYTNPQLGVGHRAAFRQLLVEARHKARTGGIAGAQLWRFPKFA